MKDYYEILHVPLTATREEIKTQYKQLVRTYHPDLFRNATDKAAAEEKLKQINIAFQVLSGKAIHGAAQNGSTPLPVAYPPILDFGTVRPGSKSTRLLQVNNLGSNVTNVVLRFSGDSRLFRVSQGKRVYGDRAFPLHYAVSADTQRMAADTAHRGWIEVDLDGITTQVELALQIGIAPQRRWGNKRPFQLSKRWGIAVLVILFSGLLGAVLPVISPQFTLYRLLPTALFASPFYVLQSDDLLFSLQEEASPALYAGGATGQTLTRLGISGRAAVGSQARQQVAYLGSNGEIYILDLQSGQHQPLTHDGQPKTALAWSPDGARLAYLTGEGESARITVHDLASGLTSGKPYTLPRVVPAGVAGITGGVNHYAWSPDGKVILFDWWQGAERRVYRIAVDGNNLQQLTHFDSWRGAWSANGQGVVVSSPKGIYRLGAQGQNLTRLSTVAGESPSWSPDGKWLAYLARTASGARQTLWVVEIASSRATQVADESVRYAWAATGDTLGYVTSLATTERPLFYLWTLTPGQPPQLVAEVADPFFD